MSKTEGIAPDPSIVHIEIRANYRYRRFSKGITIDPADSPEQVTHKLKILVGALDRTLAITMGIFSSGTNIKEFHTLREQWQLEHKKSEKQIDKLMAEGKDRGQATDGPQASQ